jgi:hypothetical protein
MSISQMKIILIYFFDIKIIFNFKFTRPNSRQILCVEILKQLFVAVSRKKLQLLASDWFSTMTMFQLTRRTLWKFMAQK